MRVLSVIAIFSVGLVVVATLPTENQRQIVGGVETTIENFPYISALLYSSDLINYWHSCVGTIINNRSILSTARVDVANRWRIRVGSTYANSGGVVHNAHSIISHPDYEYFYSVNDVAILRSSIAFSFNNNVGAASIAGPNYNVGDYQIVRAIGWGTRSLNEPLSEQLRHLQLWSIHHQTCKLIYDERGMIVTDDMMCSGWFDYPNREDCLGAHGGPVTHNNVIVGVSSWAQPCSASRFPAVSTQISRYTSWIQTNA